MCTRTALIALGLAIASIGCSKESSEGFPTSAIYPKFEATSDGQNTTLSAELSPSGSAFTYIELTGEDALVATGMGMFTRLSKSRDALGVVEYGATLPRSEPAAAIRFSLERGLGKAPAERSVVVLPDDFEVTDPPAGGYPVSRESEPLTIRWFPAETSDAVRIKVSGCVSTYETGELSDTGFYTVDPGRLTGAGREECTLKVEVAKRRSGTLDPAFSRGQIHGTQVRTRYFVSTP